MYTDEQLIEMLKSRDINLTMAAQTFLYSTYLIEARYLVQGNRHLKTDANSLKMYTHDVLAASIEGLIGRIQAGKEPDNFKAYFRRIIKNKFLNKVKEVSGLPISIDDEDGFEVVDGDRENILDGIDEESHFLKTLRSVFYNLTNHERYIICLRLFKGLKHGEIANKLNISRDKASQDYSRAIREMRDVLLNQSFDRDLNTKQSIFMDNLCQQYQNHTDNE
jgi:RNA polymerase sigma factor (sigma-70 family)